MSEKPTRKPIERGFKKRQKEQVLDKLDELIDWDALVELIRPHYTTGAYSNKGKKAIPVELLLRMLVLQCLYKGASERDIEYELLDRDSYKRFCRITSNDEVPDHSVLSRFRSALARAGQGDVILNAVNDALEAQGILLRQGAIIDASFTKGARKSPRKRPEGEDIAPQHAKGTDPEAAIGCKNGVCHDGYKRSYIVASDTGLVLGAVTTPANVHDVKMAAELVGKAGLSPGSPVYADKGYASGELRKGIRDAGLKDQIMHKAVRNRPLTAEQREFNKCVQKVRYKVERVFGTIKLWIGDLQSRYVGRSKTHFQHCMQAIGYNLLRYPSLRSKA